MPAFRRAGQSSHLSMMAVKTVFGRFELNRQIRIESCSAVFPDVPGTVTVITDGVKALCFLWSVQYLVL